MVMKKVLAAVMSLSVVFGCLQMDSISAKAAPAAYAGTDYIDDLDYQKSNMDKAHWANGDMFNCTWAPENITFDNGIMDMRIDQKSDYYTGGEYRTQEYFGYGLYQVRMKPIKNDGVVSSFFTYTGSSDDTPWDEIDIEFLGKDTTHVQFNYYVDGCGGHEKWYDLGFDASEAFHTYGFNWYPGGITWYVDGEPVYTAPNTDSFPSHPSKIMMNVWPGIGVDDWLKPYDGTTPLHAYYDWFSWEVSSSNPPYKLINYNSGLALDVPYGNKENGTNILQYPYCGYDHQKWTIELQSDGYYIIKNLETGGVLTDEDFADWDGANVHQWEYVGNDNQKWRIVPAENNTYKIINKCSGLLLTVEWASKDANANIEQYHDEHSPAQLWWIDLAD